ncbi:MAG TPA: 50S ribosomal protein L29 [Candidatus Paceibacterota bacterium]|nr:50S ribosomal protein L29 [Candidatus Paceibacterota bacterium]
MKKTTYKGKDERELAKTLKEKREALKNFHFNLSGSKVRNVKEGRGLRKDIARILTELNQPKVSAK